jgi:hypothetical protein
MLRVERKGNDSMFTSGKHGIKRKLGVAGAVAGVLLLATQSPAAANVWLEHGWDTAQLDTRADWVAVKDYECDGNGVYVHYRMNGGLQYEKVWDENGCSGNGWWEEYADDDIDKWRLCENRNGCTAWVEV